MYPGGSRGLSGSRLRRQHGGCWTGELLGLVAVHDPTELVGVDIPGPRLPVEQRRFPGTKLLPMGSSDHFPDELRARFDTVFFLEMLEHLPRGSAETTALAALAGSPGRRRRAGALHACRRSGSAVRPGMAAHRAHRNYREANTIGPMMAGAGLAVQRVCYQGNTWTSIDTSLLYGYKHVLRRQYVTPAGIARHQPQTLYPVRRIESTNIWLKALGAKAAHRTV